MPYTNSPSSTPSSQLVTNHLLHFLALDRSDAKKFQILQLIAALLGWTDEQREQAGLARPSTMSSGGAARRRRPPTPHRPPPPRPPPQTRPSCTGRRARPL